MPSLLVAVALTAARAFSRASRSGRIDDHKRAAPASPRPDSRARPRRFADPGARMIKEGPTPAIHGAARWRIVDLCQWLFEEFRIAIAEQTMSREARSFYRSSCKNRYLPRSCSTR